MRGRCFFWTAWAVATAVCTYDALFAWRYRAFMSEWELNPLATWAAGNFGILPVFGFKFFALAFAAGLAIYLRRRQRWHLEWPLTYSISGAYSLLGVHYWLAGLM